MKAGVKLAYKPAFMPVFPSDGHPMLLVRPKAAQEDNRMKLLECYILPSRSDVLRTEQAGLLYFHAERLPHGFCIMSICRKGCQWHASSVRRKDFKHITDGRKVQAFSDEVHSEDFLILNNDGAPVEFAHPVGECVPEFQTVMHSGCAGLRNS